MTEATYQLWNLIITGAGVVIGVAVVIIYGKQLSTMRGQLAEMKTAGTATEQQVALASRARLHIDGVRVADFASGMEPVFFVKIVNSGPVAAENVAVSIRVETSEGGAKYTGGEHRIMIPAHDSREYFIRWASRLNDTLVNGFKSDTPLSVSGYFEYEGKRTEYCYKYNACSGERPQGVPEFIPCDFDTRRTILATGKALAGSIAIAGSVTMKKIPKGGDNPIPSDSHNPGQED